MQAKVNSIGKFKGIMLSKTMIEKYYTKDTAQIKIEEEHKAIKLQTKARKNWEKAFKKMHENGDDKLLMLDIFKDQNH